MTDPVTGVYLSGNSMTFNLHYHYRRETCKAICPSFFEAFSDANANLKYVELIMTAIIALILIPAGIVKARPGNDKDATIGSVIRSTDGMMVSPSLAPVPASSTYATAHASHELVLRACCGTCGRRSIFSSSRIKLRKLERHAGVDEEAPKTAPKAANSSATPAMPTAGAAPPAAQMVVPE